MQFLKVAWQSSSEKKRGRTNTAARELLSNYLLKRGYHSLFADAKPHQAKGASHCLPSGVHMTLLLRVEYLFWPDTE